MLILISGNQQTVEGVEVTLSSSRRLPTRRISEAVLSYGPSLPSNWRLCRTQDTLYHQYPRICCDHVWDKVWRLCVDVCTRLANGPSRTNVHAADRAQWITTRDADCENSHVPDIGPLCEIPPHLLSGMTLRMWRRRSPSSKKVPPPQLLQDWRKIVITMWFKPETSIFPGLTFPIISLSWHKLQHACFKFRAVITRPRWSFVSMSEGVH